MVSNHFVRWVEWQLPYMASCWAYFPGTLAKRALLAGKRSYFGLDPLRRRFCDKWGFISAALTAMSGQRPIWINMYSGGDVLIAWRLLKQLRVEEGAYVLSTESYDGYALLSRAYGWDRTFFPPWDLGVPARRVLRALRPRALVFVQYAYFPILLRQARRAGVKTILVNGLLSRNVEVGNYPMQRALALGFYRELEAISVQTEQDYVAFRRLGVSKDRLVVTGDLGADLSHLKLTPAERRELRRQLGLAESDRVMIVGSVHPGEQTAITEAFEEVRRRVPKVRFIVAPRWVHEAARLVESLQARGFRVARRTRLGMDGSDSDGHYDVLVLDTFGELATAYGVADVAFIGSSLVPINERRGGHNLLEPLAHGVIPLFGPHMNLWQHITGRLLNVEPTLQVDSPMGLACRAAQILEGRVPTPAIRRVAEEFIAVQRGAVERTVTLLRERIEE